ncbi:MAG: murein hydrolase activator EnvC family protein [Acidimicrobiia bacterium]
MRRSLALLLTFALALSAALPVSAHDPAETRLDEIGRQIHDLTHRIQDARGQETALAKELAATEARMAELQAQVEAARAAVAEVQHVIETTEAELAEVRLELAAQKEQLAATREQIRMSRDLVRRRAVELYTQGAETFSGVILGFQDISQLAVGLEYASQVLASTEQLVTSLEVLERQEERHKALMQRQEAELVAVAATLEQKRADLAAQQAELEGAEAAVAAQRADQVALLADIQYQIDHFEGEINALEEDAERIKAEIRARQSAGTERPGGALLWPTDGPVTSGFGYRIHPISGVSKLHTGIDIDGAYGQAIVAGASGTVILASWYGGYGQAVVIDHGGGLATLYAHMSSMAVSSGASVAAGDVIGYVGSTGYSTGSHLHFEVRENGNPVDPMAYL